MPNDISYEIKLYIYICKISVVPFASICNLSVYINVFNKHLLVLGYSSGMINSQLYLLVKSVWTEFIMNKEQVQNKQVNEYITHA